MNQQIVVKGYQLIKKIDQSGLKTIYRAVQVSTGSSVFLTLIPVHAGGALQMLQHRASQAKRLLHSGLCVPLDYGVVDERYFYYTNHARPSLLLKDVLERSQGTKEYWYLFAGYFMQLLEIVNYVHAAKTTHRDITTLNVRLDRKNRVLLEGFINARPKQEARNIANIVNLPYMAPEQLCGACADAKTDIYSLGVVFFELLTGSIPYESNYVKIDENQRGKLPSFVQYRLDVPQTLQCITLRALAPRDCRYSHLQQWIKDLEEYYEERSLRLKFHDLSCSIKNIFALSH